MRPVLCVALLAMTLAGCGQSSHAQDAVVPNVVGLRSPDATVRLLEAGLCPSLRVDPGAPMSRVIGQSPAAGRSLPQAALVSITIGVSPKGGFRTGVDTQVMTLIWGGSAPSKCPPIEARSP